MSEGSGSGKRPAIGLQIKLPCATLEDVKKRYGEDLKKNNFFVRTKTPRPRDTLVRLETQLSSGAPLFRAAAIVSETTELGMRLQLLGADEAGRELIAALGGKPPPPLKTDPKAAPRPEKPAAKIPAIGIDLGTSHCAAAVVKDGRPVVIDGIPSLVALDEKGKVVVGQAAKGQ